MDARQALRDYLGTDRHAAAGLAEKLGVTFSAVWRWANAKRKPSTALAFALERETGGRVPAALWPETPLPKKRGRKRALRKGRGSSRTRHARSLAQRVR